MSYRLLALDMDGTVLNNKQQISDNNRKWIHKAIDEGIIVCFATGRGIQNVISYVEELELDSPIVTVNGSEVWKKPHELHNRHLIPSPQIVELRQLAIQYDVWYWGYAVEGLYRKEGWLEDHEDFNWLKFGVYTEDSSKLQTITETVRSWDVFEITNSHPNNIELNPKGISKASGLREVCQIYGIDMGEVVAAGDSLNDLAMIQHAGFGVAMGNAQETIKQAADFITLTNEEDGIAHLIESHLLNHHG